MPVFTTQVIRPHVFVQCSAGCDSRESPASMPSYLHSSWTLALHRLAYLESQINVLTLNIKNEAFTGYDVSFLIPADTVCQYLKKTIYTVLKYYNYLKTFTVTIRYSGNYFLCYYKNNYKYCYIILHTNVFLLNAVSR